VWYSREQFALCDELRIWGLVPRFEPGDVVARGFADLGFEEFQVLPGPSLLSLTAGTTKALPEDHRHHFFWIPSVDETVELIESRGGVLESCQRQDGRTWVVKMRLAQHESLVDVSDATLHTALLMALHRLLRGKES
jgi:hypothetical protein